MTNSPQDAEIVESALATKRAGSLVRLDYGSIALSSGGLIVADPGTHGGSAPVSLPPGTYPVYVLLNQLTWAYAVISLHDAAPVAWQRLGSVPVDTGAVSFMSAEASDRFLAWRPPGDLTKELWDPFYATTRGPNHQHALASRPSPKPFHLRLDDDPSLAIPVFHAGFGDGQYPFFLGRDSAGAPCRFVLDFNVGGRSIDDDDDEPAAPLPLLPPDDAAFLALDIDEVEDTPERDTPAMARACEQHEAGVALQGTGNYVGAIARYLDALISLRGTTVPYPELLHDVAICYLRLGADEGRQFAEAAAVRFERRARSTRGRAQSLFQLARAWALAGRKSAMLQALKQSIALHAGNAGKVKVERDFAAYLDDRDMMTLLALARRGR
jgi:hypothetical protein